MGSWGENKDWELAEELPGGSGLPADMTGSRGGKEPSPSRLVGEWIWSQSVGGGWSNREPG